jgi:hypothetical protein
MPVDLLLRNTESRHKGERKRPRKPGRPPLSVAQILAWAEEHHSRTGRWPQAYDGPISGVESVTWLAVQVALYLGYRGLPGNISLAKLLLERRGVRPWRRSRGLTVEQVLEWADDFHARTGRWPKVTDDRVLAPGGPKWNTVNGALRAGRRGLPGEHVVVEAASRAARSPALEKVAGPDRGTGSGVGRFVLSTSQPVAQRKVGRHR